ncbi:MAG: adenylate/guanylate cyclase domain-containing protein, partial [Pseudomonadota bacterium]
MAERLDPEEMREILSWYQRIVGETVAETGGYVACFMGDGALIYFGYPRSTDHAPRQAVHAALAINTKIKARRADNLKTYGVEVDARVGIHTGLAVIAEMGGGHRQATADVIGETPNIAARL